MPRIAKNRARRAEPSTSRILRLVVYLVIALGLIYGLSQREGTAPVATGPASQGAPGTAGDAPERERAPSSLPAEAVATLHAIERGGPFPYERDGVTFQNRERRLPDRPRGYYREYTVPTPGSRDRGARRIISGGDPPEVYYYTDDHYRSFRRVELPQ
jgi:guanyl-specific ribonuclease Sa